MISVGIHGDSATLNIVIFASHAFAISIAFSNAVAHVFVPAWGTKIFLYSSMFKHPSLKLLK